MVCCAKVSAVPRRQRATQGRGGDGVVSGLRSRCACPPFADLVRRLGPLFFN